jgi:hypothetical protein
MKQSITRAFVPLAAASAMAVQLTHQLPGWAGQNESTDKNYKQECVILDNDFDIDDMQAIPLVLGNKHVAAIIQSEGYTLPAQAAPAVNALVNLIPDRPNSRKIPIIVGGKQAQSPDLNRWPWLPFFRSMMNLSNGLLTSAPRPWPYHADYPKQVLDSVRDCETVSILLIGSYTSFNNYLPLIKDKVRRVVIMGEPIGDESRTPGRESFNCSYDFEACKKAMPVLKQLKTFFVEVPRLSDCSNTKRPAQHCYSPSLAMVQGEKMANGQYQGGLIDQGLPGQLRRALLNNISCSTYYTTPETVGRPCSSRSTWEPAAVAGGPGGEMLLWDQSAALFLVDPTLFSLYFPEDAPEKGGKHYEPTLVNGSHEQTVEKLRRVWTEATNKSEIIQ